MPRIAITEPSDPRIAWYRDLPRNKIPRASGLFLVEGRWMLERLLDSGYEVESILSERGQCDLLLPRIPAEAPLFEADRALLSLIVGYRFHRGVLACGRRRTPPSLEQVLREAESSGPEDRRTVVVCPEVQDPENLGGIIRNCTALGAVCLVLGPHCGDPFSRRALRVSMGNALYLPIVEADPLSPALELLRSRFGYALAATVLDAAAEPLPAAAHPGRLALLFGGEGFGLAERERGRCDLQLTLPMARGADSLNLAASVGVFLYHFQHVARRSGS